MKPVKLFQYQMMRYIKGDDLALDSFVGSGTTIIACEKHRRRATAMEFDPIYCDVTINRWQDYTSRGVIQEASEISHNELKIAVETKKCV